MPVKLWLDDIRSPADHVGEGWTWAKTAGECIATLGSRTVTELSLDYDLERGGYGCPACIAGAACDAHITGMDVVHWLTAHPQHWPARVAVHSANPAGKARILAAIERRRQLR